MIWSMETEGIDHLNMWSKSKYEIGRFLSNFKECPVETPDGLFQSIEGYWGFLSVKEEYREPFRTYSGVLAKKKKQECVKAHGGVFDPDFEKKIEMAVRNKLESHKDFILQNRELLSLSIVHYYEFDNRIMDETEKFDWWVNVVRKKVSEILGTEYVPVGEDSNYQKKETEDMKKYVPEVDPKLYLGKTVCFDTETTGISKRDEIIQISIINEDEEELLTTFIKPEKNKSWPEAEAVNGISPKMVKDAPSMNDVSDVLSKIFDGAKQVIGYNVSFDLRMVEQCSDYVFDRKKVTDVMKQFKKDKNDKESHKLCDAVKYYCDRDFYEEFMDGAHKADMDTLATVKVWKKQEELLSKVREEESLKKEKLSMSKPKNGNGKTMPVISDDPNKISYAGIGSRNTPKEILNLFERMGEWLAGKGLTLRSGHAQGADLAFEKGCDNGGGKKEIFLPWNGFNYVLYHETGNPESVTWTTVGKNAVQVAEKMHPYFSGMKMGARSLMARNTYQVLGECDVNETKPSRFILCYTPGGEGQGGTGQALRIARELDIPIFDAGNYERDGEFDMDLLKKDFNAFIKDVLTKETQKEFLDRQVPKAKEFLEECRMKQETEMDFDR